MTRLQFPITGTYYKSFNDGVDIAVEYTRNDSDIIFIHSIRYYYNQQTMEVYYNCSYTELIHSAPQVNVGDIWIDVELRVRLMADEIESELRNIKLEAIESELGFTLPRPHKISDLINPDETNFDTNEEINERRAADEQDILTVPPIPPTPPAPSDRSPPLTASSSLVNTTNPDGTIELIRSDGQELPPIPINQLPNDGRTPAYLTVQTGEDHIAANIKIYDENDNLISDTSAAQLSVLNKSTEEPAPKRQRTRWELLELD